LRVIVAGGRNFVGNDTHRKWLRLQLMNMDTDLVLCGMAKGADLFGKSVAVDLNIAVAEYPADWNKYNRRAGYIRNKQMSENADACILFPGGIGTEMMKVLSKEKRLILIEYNEELKLEQFYGS